MTPILRVDNLGKQYRIGAHKPAYTTLRETIVGLANAPLRRLREGNGSSANNMIWVLHDVSFEIAPGEVIG